jgi:hypothetical protein
MSVQDKPTNSQQYSTSFCYDLICYEIIIKDTWLAGKHSITNTLPYHCPCHHAALTSCPHGLTAALDTLDISKDEGPPQGSILVPELV